MLDGTSLVHATCSDFFTTAGETQVWLIFSRDTTAAVAAIATGILTLHGASKNAIANIAFGSTALYAGIDTYTKNFLFAADNIASVRELTMRALDAHKQKMLEIELPDYSLVMTLIQDNQEVCSPRSIARLAKTAISSGTVTASTSPDDSFSKLTQLADDSTMQRIGDALGQAGPLTFNQTGALYWLIVAGATDQERDEQIAPVLATIKSIPFSSDGKVPAKYTYDDSKWAAGAKEKTRSLLGLLSDAKQAAFKTTIATARVEVKRDAPAEAPIAVLGSAPPGAATAPGTANAGAPSPAAATAVLKKLQPLDFALTKTAPPSHISLKVNGQL